MRSIQAVAFGGPDVLKLRELRKPEPGAGEVVVDVAIAPVLFVDSQIRAGLAREWFPAVPPYVPGAGVAGTVARVGDDVDPAWVGHRVVADTPTGGYLEQAVVAEDGLIAVPEGLELPKAAALLHDGRTALGLIEVTAPQPGERVLVTAAAGGLGVLLIQLARSTGADVIGAARGERKLAVVRELGAIAAIDYSRPDWTDAVLATTEGSGVDVVLDGAGGQIGMAAFQLVGNDGRFSAHGSPAGPIQLDIQDATRRGITVTGIDRVQFAPSEIRRLTAQALAEAAAARIDPIIGQTFPLERAIDAHQAIESRATIGKTLLEI